MLNQFLICIDSSLIVSSSQLSSFIISVDAFSVIITVSFSFYCILEFEMEPLDSINVNELLVGNWSNFKCMQRVNGGKYKTEINQEAYFYLLRSV